MKRLLLLLGALACAQASNINITSSQDALSYVLNLKCIQAQFYSWAAHGKGLDIGLLGWKGHQDNNSSSPKVFSSVGDHDMWDHKSDCQEYKDCPGNCKDDQGCKDACALKTCYYYHCDNYKTCWDACQDQNCKDQCSHKGCDYGLLNQIQNQIDQDVQQQGQQVGNAIKKADDQQNKLDNDINGQINSQVNDWNKQQHVIGKQLNETQSKLDNDIGNQANKLNDQQNKLDNDVADQQHKLDKQIGDQAQKLNQTANELGQQQKDVDQKLGQQQKDVDQKLNDGQKNIDKTIQNVGQQVQNDLKAQQEFLDRYIGGQQAQLSWLVKDIAEQLSWTEAEHVKQLRKLLGDNAPECPKLDISVDTWDKILKLALGNENWNSWGQKYSPYYDDISFMIGAYLFEDLGVSAYAGVMDQFKQDQEQQLELIKILSVESYQSGLVRSWLYQNGAYPVDWFNSMQVIDLVQKVSDMRYKLGGGKDEGITIPKVQGSLWVPQVSSPDYKLAIAPTDDQGLIWDRKPQDVANILFGGDYQKPGLFFPDGWKWSI